MTERQKQAQKWLNRYYPHYLELEALRERIEVLYGDLNKCVGSYERSEIQLNTNSKQHREELLAEVADMNEVFETKIIQLKRMDEEILDSIMKVETPLHRTMLTYRFIDRLKWENIAEKTSYSPRQAYRIQLDALDEIYPIIFGG